MGYNFWALAMGAGRMDGYMANFSYNAGIVRARSKEEAIEYGMKKALQNWPQSEGWQSHGAVAVQMPSDRLSPSPTVSLDRQDAQRGDGRTPDGRKVGE